MILSASRRTDIPAFYLDWFLERLRQGEILVRNPMRPRQVKRIAFRPADVDGIVFWTKNPAPILGALDRLAEYPFYLLYTLNPYGPDLEGDVPAERERLDVFRRLADRLGPERVVWRYDPIVISDRYNEAFHEDNFSRLAAALSGHTGECKTSFLAPYPKIGRAIRELGLVLPDADAKKRLAARLRQAAENSRIVLSACCDPDLADAGLVPAACVDAGRLGRIGGRAVPSRKDSGQRKNCSCSESVDVGAYNTCTHACRYCYANHSAGNARANRQAHNPLSPLLSGTLHEDDEVTDRKSQSSRTGAFMNARGGQLLSSTNAREGL